jgi:hypothetical protein
VIGRDDGATVPTGRLLRSRIAHRSSQRPGTPSQNARNARSPTGKRMGLRSQRMTDTQQQERPLKSKATVSGPLR